jgi:tRNA-splicing ligase RtcB
MMRMLESGDLSMTEFQKSMEGIFSTSISKKTIDESPRAYKTFEDIEFHVKETVDIEQIAKPVYNLKADGEEENIKKRQK